MTNPTITRPPTPLARPSPLAKAKAQVKMLQQAMVEFCWLEQDLNKQIAEEQEAVTAARIRAAKLLQAVIPVGRKRTNKEREKRYQMKRRLLQNREFIRGTEETIGVLSEEKLKVVVGMRTLKFQIGWANEDVTANIRYD